METGECIFELLATSPMCHAPQTGAVPVELSVGQHHTIHIILRQTRHHLGLIYILFGNKDGHIFTWWGITGI